MDSFPSQQTVPSVALERLFFGLWITFSIISVTAFGVIAIRHPAALESAVGGGGTVLISCSLFGCVGFMLRRRRLKRLATRQRFLQALSNLP